jgi:uncharacterized membrane protein
VEKYQKGYIICFAILISVILGLVYFFLQYFEIYKNDPQAFAIENELTLIIIGVFAVIFIAIVTKKRINNHEYHINCVDKVSLKSYGDIIRIFFLFNR